MRHNQSKKFIFMIIVICAPCLFGSQQPKVSVDWLKSIATLQRYQHEQYRLYSERQLILTLKPDEKKTQSFYCSRLDSDTLLLSSIETKNDERFTIASIRRKGDWEQQLQDMQQIFSDKKDFIKKIAVMVLHCVSDRGRTFLDDDVLSDYDDKLKKIFGVDPQVIGYSMIPGKDHRDKEHFECRITTKEVVWKSAIDNFQERKL